MTVEEIQVPNFDPPHLWPPYGVKNSNFLGTIRTNLEQLAHKFSGPKSEWGAGAWTSNRCVLQDSIYNSSLEQAMHR